MLGIIRKSPSKLNIFDLFNDDLYVNKIIQILRKKYDIKLSNWYGNLGFEEFQEIIINNIKINISWDQMSGCSIMASDFNGNQLIEKIATYLNSHYSYYLQTEVNTKNVENYYNSVIEKMNKCCEGEKNKDKIARLYREVHFLYTLGDLSDEYFNKISHEFKKIRANS